MFFESRRFGGDVEGQPEKAPKSFQYSVQKWTKRDHFRSQDGDRKRGPSWDTILVALGSVPALFWAPFWEPFGLLFGVRFRSLFRSLSGGISGGPKAAKYASEVGSAKLGRRTSVPARPFPQELSKNDALASSKVLKSRRFL